MGGARMNTEDVTKRCLMPDVLTWMKNLDNWKAFTGGWL